MAILYPPLDAIQRLKVPPTHGERKLLEVLLQKLGDEYEIFFQPFVNGDNPDFAILKKGGGVILIEVKDWKLDHYGIKENFEWILKKNEKHIKSPFEQLKQYKDNLYHLQIEGLCKQLQNNKCYWAIVGCAVYFHGTTKQEFDLFVNQNLHGKSLEKYKTEIEYYGKVFEDNVSKISMLPKKFGQHVKSKLFTDELYGQFFRTLKHPFHYLEQGKDIPYSKSQLALTNSLQLQKRKIKGFAGCGKTLVLAKRAVQAHKLTVERVLILTYNLALVNYIHDRISDVREDFAWENFYITNYHQFFITQANNFNLPIEDLSCFNDAKFFEFVAEDTPRFKAIYIDEIQDYQQSWIDLITEYFLDENQSEFIVFGDEKQNIYGRPLDENKEIVVRQVPGKWNQSLNTSYRFTEEIASVILKFQERFLSQKYNQDILSKIENLDIFDIKHICYTRVEYFNPESITAVVYSFLRTYKIHSSDCAILGPKVDKLRQIERVIRLNEREETTITFETLEEYEVLERESKRDADKLVMNSHMIDKSEKRISDLAKDLLRQKLDIMRRDKKINFYMGTGKIKLSTVHSFKGWESHTVVLLIENESNNNHEYAELIYAGMTRARKNIVFINIGNSAIDNFFISLIDKDLVERLTVDNPEPVLPFDH